MPWILVVVLPSLLWGVVNHIDKYLLSKAPYHSSVNVLMVYSTLFSIILLPFVFVFARTQILADTLQILIQIVGGLLLTGSVYFYLIALNKDETSNVIPLALLVPIFGYAFSFILLGEILSIREIVACLIILAGALILSLEVNEENKIRVKAGVILTMIFCTIFQAAQETLFKFVTINNSIAVSFFWLHTGILLFGLSLLAFKRGLWNEFVLSVNKNGRKIFGINISSELVNAIAYMIRDYSTLLAPIAIIATLNSYQPAFVFILGIFLTVFFPKFVKETIKPIHLIHKAIAITIMVLGTVMIV